MGTRWPETCCATYKGEINITLKVTSSWSLYPQYLYCSLILPCRQCCQYWGGKTYLKRILKYLNLAVQHLKDRQKTTGMKGADTSTKEATGGRHMLCCQVLTFSHRCTFAFLHIVGQRSHAAQQIRLCKRKFLLMFCYENTFIINYTSYNLITFLYQQNSVSACEFRTFLFRVSELSWRVTLQAHKDRNVLLAAACFVGFNCSLRHSAKYAYRNKLLSFSLSVTDRVN